jgi:simple sugar transport system permease protein
MVAIIAIVHGDVQLALISLWNGAFGDVHAVAETLIRATPLCLAGLGVAVAFRAKMFNIGGEGQFLVGTLLASAVAVNCPVTRHLPHGLLIVAMIAGGTLAGALWAALAGALKTWRDVPEVISTIMLNFVAIELFSYLVTGPMERSDLSQPSTELLANVARLPILITGTRLHAGVLVALAAVVVVWFIMRYTVAGFAITAVGDNPEAATLCGYSTARTYVTAMMISGGLCGLAGAVELSGSLFFLPEGYTPGYGYTAVAVALLGRLNPIGVALSAVFFGALSAGSDKMERSAGIAHEVGFVLQAGTLMVLLATQNIKAAAKLPSFIGTMLTSRKPKDKA